MCPHRRSIDYRQTRLQRGGNRTTTCLHPARLRPASTLDRNIAMVSPRWRLTFSNRYPVSNAAYRSWESFTSVRFPKMASASSNSRTAPEALAPSIWRPRFFSVSPMYLLAPVATRWRDFPRAAAISLAARSICTVGHRSTQTGWHRKPEVLSGCLGEGDCSQDPYTEPLRTGLFEGLPC